MKLPTPAEPQEVGPSAASFGVFASECLDLRRRCEDENIKEPHVAKCDMSNVLSNRPLSG